MGEKDLKIKSVVVKSEAIVRIVRKNRSSTEEIEIVSRKADVCGSDFKYITKCEENLCVVDLR